jgi:hypothetical protein
MRITFTRLFTVHIRHGFYADGRARGDLMARPLPATAAHLEALGLGFRALPDGFTVYGETDGAAPPRLVRPLGAVSLQFAFLLEPANPYLASMTELPDFRPARQAFCFDNLREDITDSRAHLGDAVAGRRLGDPVDLVTAPSVTYRFPAPVNADTLTVRDRFGVVAHAASFALSNPIDRTDAYRLALADIDATPPGRYTIEDASGGRMALRYAPDVGAARPMAFVDIYSSTAGLAPGSDRVPAAYRFLAADGTVTPREYHLQLEPRATTWRYNVVRKYAADDSSLADLAIAGGVAFARTLESGRAVFVSSSPVALSEQAPVPALELRDATHKLRDLPHPGAATPLKAGSAPGSFTSEIFVYV